MEWQQLRPKLLGIGIVLILICGICAIATVVFYPKPRVIGGLRGMIGPDEQAYREDYQCLGVPYDFCPDWPDYGCTYHCYGLLYDRQCSIETYDTEQGGMVQTSTDCRDTSE